MQQEWMERILGALARGYCYQQNQDKVLDPTLIESMAKEVYKEIEQVLDKAWKYDSLSD